MNIEDAVVALIEAVSGNVATSRDRSRLVRIVARRADLVTGGDLEAYVALLDQGRDSDEWRRLLSEVTVNESYLFRAPQQFAALEGVLLEELTARRRSRQLRVWVAGCARGEEAASVAITLAESPWLEGWSWIVHATDVDDRALEQARRVEFGRRAMSRVSTERIERWFSATGSSWRLADTLRDRIRFRHLNLADAEFTPPTPVLDVVFLRNVLIYFRPDGQRRVVDRIAGHLADDGVVFLGPSESLWRVSDAVRPQDLGSCFCYRPRRFQEVVEDEAVPVAVPVGASPRAVHGVGPARDRAVELLARREADRAAAWLVGAMHDHPEDAHLRTLSARADELLGDRDAARRSYRAAVYLEPHLFHARMLLAQCLERIARPRRARAEWLALLQTLEAGRGIPLVGWERLELPDETTSRSLARAALGTDRDDHGPT